MAKKKIINHALVEGVRPAMYAAMKYWGKKPHNIWREYIEANTQEGGAVFDPFAGSAVAAFEAVKAGRKAVVFDINPMTSFLIEAYCSEFHEQKFSESVRSIVSQIQSDSVYRKAFGGVKCHECGSPSYIVQHCKWEGGKIYEMGVEPESGKCCKPARRQLRRPGTAARAQAAAIQTADIDKPPLNKFWIPCKEFPFSLPSFSANFTECLGGKRFRDLWTGRNLYTLSRIFDLILKSDESVKKHLLLGFVQILHLCCKMCVPRRAAARRPFSTSWGRSAYVCANRQMEMNPLPLFLRNCLGGRQSVRSSVSAVRCHLGKIPNIVRVDDSRTASLSKHVDIKYGIADAVAMGRRFVSEKDGVQFIITDPPYGGLVQYLDLSSIWLAWLEKHDSRFVPDYASEITIKEDVCDLDAYRRRMARAVKNMVSLIPDNGRIVFTFHNKDIAIWNAFLHALFEAGLRVERVIHQPNRRTGESNVANPYGTSANDFYIHCVKAKKAHKPSTRFPEAAVAAAKRIIAQRNEPTPYQILFNGMLSEISVKGFRLEKFDEDVQSILRERIGEDFVIVGGGDKRSGPLWWLAHPDQVVKRPELTLSDRVRGSVLGILRENASVSLDEALAEIYVNYPNGLTPDHRSVQSYLAEYASKSHGKWNYKGDRHAGVSDHTEMLRLLASIGRKMGYRIRIGKREMPEKCEDGRPLASLADNDNVRDYIKSAVLADRVEQIDMLWLDAAAKKVACVIEVENTTSFVHGIQRASNLGAATPKVMVVPSGRLGELKRALRDRLTRKNFIGQNWRCAVYPDIKTLAGKRKITPALWDKTLRGLDNLGSERR